MRFGGRLSVIRLGPASPATAATPAPTLLLFFRHVFVLSLKVSEKSAAQLPLCNASRLLTLLTFSSSLRSAPVENQACELPASPQHLPGGGSSRALVASLAPRAVFCVSAERCTHTRRHVSRSAHACPSPSRRGFPQAASPDAAVFGSDSATLITQLHPSVNQRVARSRTWRLDLGALAQTRPVTCES